MQCPVDGTELLMTDRQGVEIDYCPKCRGVWLDRGELDKIIERQLSETAHAAPPRPMHQHADAAAQSYRPDPRGYRDDDRRRHDGKYYRKKKRKSLLSEIFDFD
ncbi:zf-TFIIB domain-containing protein [Pseudooceanicola aestuarii]|uniref:TFIIB-type zinc ribbon-containing protein n=1 Tax=Pseudooceanicola aestuarii TaxID=2697319 RepID=UPI0013D4A42C|nr:zf-TFIIB domain-containing protein [Pseudooceanicola aestuarii]